MENYSLDNMNKAASTNGAVIGIISVVLTLVLYYAAPQLLGSMWVGFGMFAVFLLIYIYFTLDLRKKIGGFWTFRQALKGIFLMGVVATLISTVFNFVFYKYIEPGAYEKVATAAIENARGMYENMGMNETQTDEAIVKMEESLKGQFDPTIGQCLTNLGIALIFGFIMALIFAAIFKKNPPAFQPQPDDNQ